MMTNGKKPTKDRHRNRAAEGPAPAVMLHRDDWMEFRDINRIPNKAGVSFGELPRVVVKELCDDGLDAGGRVEFGLLKAGPDEVTFFVADPGPGVDGADEEVADLYSVRRPLASSKWLRMPTRGMLGNGLRVVAGVVLVCGGQLRVCTRGRALTLKPRDADGQTEILASEPWEGKGTRVEVTLRGELAQIANDDDGLFSWAEEARRLTEGSGYKGKTASRWYDPAGFWELLQAAGDARVGAFVAANLDGCSDKGQAVAGELADRACGDLTRGEANTLLGRAQKRTRPVVPERLGKVGRRDDYYGYGCETGTFEVHGATVPFVAEAWANRAAEPGGVVCVNRTPVCARIVVRRDEGSDYAIIGCRLRHRFAAGRKDAGEFQVLVNVITPFVPLVSSGKDPDLLPMRGEILAALEKAIRVAKRTAPRAGGRKRSQKAIVRGRIHAAAAKLSGNGAFLFSLRQLFYELRPYLIQALGREPLYGTFSRIVGAYEDEFGDVESLYRDDRGTLYHPHTGQTIPLGTRSVAGYRRPAFTFRSLLFCEKEGLFPMLKHACWPERFDCALCSSKGFATRAARTLIRMLRDSPELIEVFVLHDADGPGTVIYETLREALRPYGIEVVNLGLDPAEARAMGLEAEPVRPKEDRRVPVASYIPEDDAEWLQGNRIELNAMTTPQFIRWLTAKVEGHFRRRRRPPKVVPPPAVVVARLGDEARIALERQMTDEVLREADIPARVAARLQEINDRVNEAAKALARGLPRLLKNAPEAHWSDMVRAEALEVVAPDGGEKSSENATCEASREGQKRG
jgi:hypothetical protein